DRVGDRRGRTDHRAGHHRCGRTRRPGPLPRRGAHPTGVRGDEGADQGPSHPIRRRRPVRRVPFLPHCRSRGRGIRTPRGPDERVSEHRTDDRRRAAMITENYDEPASTTRIWAARLAFVLIAAAVLTPILAAGLRGALGLVGVGAGAAVLVVAALYWALI